MPQPDPPLHDEVIAAMLARRSIREGFDGQPIPGAVLREIVRCGLAAPSSKNAQPWRMHVVTDRATLGVLADAVEKAKGVDEYVPHDPASAGRVAPISPARPSLNRPRFSMKIAAATSRSTCADSRTVET